MIVTKRYVVPAVVVLGFAAIFIMWLPVWLPLAALLVFGYLLNTVRDTLERRYHSSEEDSS